MMNRQQTHQSTPLYAPSISAAKANGGDRRIRRSGKGGRWSAGAERSGKDDLLLHGRWAWWHVMAATAMVDEKITHLPIHPAVLGVSYPATRSLGTRKLTSR